MGSKRSLLSPEQGGFTRAVHRLHRSQHAISRSLDILEHELGAPLFERLRGQLDLLLGTIQRRLGVGQGFVPAGSDRLPLRLGVVGHRFPVTRPCRRKVFGQRYRVRAGHGPGS